MDTDDLSRVEEIFQRAADLPAGERAAFLREACGRNSELHGRLEAMLARLEAGDSLGVAPGVSAAAGRVGAAGAGLAEAEEAPGGVIGRYRLLQKIGEGGYGVVYMAEQFEPVERKVALKVIKLGMDTREVIARFEAERQALALMDHPGIAKVLDGGATASGRPFFVMELVRGVSITTYCEENGLSTGERLGLFREVCLAVHHAHQKGVIHRDIKPSNVMVSLHDGRPMIKVIDFGIAKAMHTRLTQKTLFTEYNRFIGTPAYMSPEQAEMSALDIDTRSDIYSLGVLLYELLTGSTPFETRDLLHAGLAEIQRIIREVEPERPSVRVSTCAHASPRVGGEGVHERVRRLRGDLDWMVMKALEKDRTRRYASASELAEDARRHLEHEPVLAGPPDSLYRLRKFLTRHRAAVAWVTVILLALVSGIVGTTAGLIEAAAQRDQAEEAAQSARTVTEFLVRTLALADPEIALAPELSVVELLDRASMRVSRELGGEPRAEARARVAIGRAYESLGRPELAHAHLGRAIALIDGMPDYDRAELYTALWRMTHVLFVLERPEALTVAQEARRVAHAHVGDRHPDLAQALDRFVKAVDEAAHDPSPRRVADFHPLFEETVELSEQRLAPGDALWLLVADSYQHAAYDLWFAPIESESVPFWERALEIQRRELPAAHPHLAQTLSQLTGVLNRLGRLSDAETRIRESVELVHRSYPEGSFKVGVAQGALGENLTLQGRFEEAERHLIASHRAILETTDSSTFYAADSFRRLIDLYERWGREAEASQHRREFARISCRARYLQPFDIAVGILGPEQARIAEPFGVLRTLCGDIAYPVLGGGRSDPELEPTVRELIDARRALLADEDPRSIVIGRYLLHWSNQIDAEAEGEARARMIEEALRVVPAVAGSAPLEVAEAGAQAADLARRAGDRVRAEELATLALRELPTAMSADAWYGASARIRIARCLVPLGMYREAEQLLVAGYAVFLEQLGLEHSKTVAVRALAEELYRAWQRPDQLERFRALGGTR